MKKRLSTALAALILLCSLTGCAGASSPAGDPAPGDVPAQEEPTAPEAPAQPERAAHETIEMTVEGLVEQVPATLYLGEGYSFYLPDREWEKDAEKGQWKAVANDTVLFAVLAYPGYTAEQAYQEVVGLYGDYYGFREMNPDNTFSGYNGKDGHTMSVRMVPYEGGMFALWNSYPDEAEEGFASRMAFILDTFRADFPASAETDSPA